MAAEEDHTIGYTYKKLTKSNQEKKKSNLTSRGQGYPLYHCIKIQIIGVKVSISIACRTSSHDIETRMSSSLCVRYSYQLGGFVGILSVGAGVLSLTLLPVHGTLFLLLGFPDKPTYERLCLVKHD